MDEQIEFFVPQPGSVAWRVLTHLMAEPDDILMRKDVARLTGCQLNSVDAMLQKAVARQCLRMYRNNSLEVTWRLGIKQNFRLDKLDGVPAVAAPATPTARIQLPTKAQVLETAAAQTPETVAEPPRVKRAYRRRNVIDLKDKPADAAETVPGQKFELPYLGLKDLSREVPLGMESHAKCAPVLVQMPLHLTPELIEAVKNDPSTSFENKAEGHQAIGWLMDAYAVIIKTQRFGAMPRGN